MGFLGDARLRNVSDTVTAANRVLTFENHVHNRLIKIRLCLWWSARLALNDGCGDQAWSDCDPTWWRKWWRQWRRADAWDDWRSNLTTIVEVRGRGSWLIFQFGGQPHMAGWRETVNDRTVVAVEVCVRKGFTTIAVVAEAFAGRVVTFDVKPSKLVSLRSARPVTPRAPFTSYFNYCRST